MADRTAARDAGSRGDGSVETPVIVGTAGHVDHGKSSLVLALTGTDPDRLPQEKARGITIDLGFAELELPSGRSVGVVDVPGHEHYVRAMAAGAAGVDVALLVVAADDGVMPQTREHLRILEAMGARQMVVALTKSDLVEPDWLELVQLDVEEYLASTPFSGACVVPVSSRTREGLPELLARLDEAVDAFLATDAARLRTERPARLAIDRAFNVAGVGAVVTGTLRSGEVRPGDAVEVLPAGARARVRSVQTHGRDVACARAGQRTALNLVGVELAQVPRGSTVCAPGALRMRDRFDARLRWYGRDGSPVPLVSGERVHICAGTSQALGRILLFDGAQELACDREAWVQVRLEEPLALAAHDRFVAMAYSPVELVGGGEVLWCEPPRRSVLGEDDRALLSALDAGDARAAVRALVRRERLGVDAARAASSLDMPEGRASELLAPLAGAGELCALGGAPGQPAAGAAQGGQQGAAVYMAPDRLDALLADVVAALHTACAADPESSGLVASALRDAVCPRMPDGAFAGVVSAAEERGLVGRFGASIVAAEDLERVRRAAGDLADRVAAALDAHGLAAPFTAELAEELGMPEPTVRRGLTMLVDSGRAVAVERTYVMGADAYGRARSVVAEAIRSAGGQATASALREALGLSRKYALPLLEHFDRVGFTVRSADEQSARRLAKP